MQTNINTISPVETDGTYFFKREDKFEFAGVRGAKIRAAVLLAQGAAGLVTAGSRKSPQVNIVATVAREMGLPCHCHVPQGELYPEVKSAREKGAEIIQYRAGYNTVIIARAREDAARLGWKEIPFGMTCQEAIDLTAKQVVNIPKCVKRIIIPIGSAVNFCGLLWGLQNQGRTEVDVIGIKVGKDPMKTIKRFAPPFWELRGQVIPALVDYNTEIKGATIGGILLDPIYEAKCLPFINPGDLFR